MNKEKEKIYLEQLNARKKKIADEFLERANLKEITEESIDKKLWLLKSISIREGYITSTEVKQYILENYK